MCNAQMNIEQGKCVNGCIMRKKHTIYSDFKSLAENTQQYRVFWLVKMKDEKVQIWQQSGSMNCMT